MSKVAILTDSNSGITPVEAEKWGVYVIPMPFFINDEVHYENVDFSQEKFYEALENDIDVHTSMPAPADTMDLWNELLKDHDEIIYIPMSSGLSSSCSTAISLSHEEEYEGKVFVVNNQRISITQKQATLEAKELADAGFSAKEIAEKLMEVALDSQIYIMVDTLYYLKKGGRLTPAVAAIGTLLRIKPVLQIYGEKLDQFAKARTVKQAKQIMIEQLQKDVAIKLKDPECKNSRIAVAYTKNREAAIEFAKELNEVFPDQKIWLDPLSLSVSCHIGPGAIACGCTKNIIDIEKYK